MLTDRMIRVCNLVGITLLDHIIVGGDNERYFSFREKGVMMNVMAGYQTDYQKIEFEEAVVAEKNRKSMSNENNNNRKKLNSIEH